MQKIDFNVKDLPTRGVFYPEVKTISLKRYTLEQIEELSDTEKDIGTLIDDFKKDLIGIDPDKLLYADFLYMSMYRTATVYNNDKLFLELVCPHCGQTFETSIDYAKVELFDFDNYIDILPVKIEINKTEYAFNLPTLAHIKQLIELQEKKLNYEFYKSLQNTEINEDDKNLRVTKKRIDEQVAGYIKDGIIPLLELSNKLLTFGILSNEDALKTAEAIKNIEDGSLLEILGLVDELSSVAFKPMEILCTKCQEKFNLSLEGVATLVRPFRASTADIAEKIRLSRKSKHSTKSTSKHGLQ